MYQKEDFVITTTALASAHGVHTSTISNWTSAGAFPHARRGEGKSTLFYPNSTLRFTGGQIKTNIKYKKFKKPAFVFEETKPKSDFKSTQPMKPMSSAFDLEQFLSQTADILTGLDRKLTRIETKIHALAEGRPLEAAEHYNSGSNPKIGDMIKKTFQSKGGS